MHNRPRLWWTVVVAVALLAMMTPLVVMAAETITWTTRAPMPTARRILAVAALGNDIYAIGGYHENDTLATVERYTPATDSWVERASLPAARYAGAAVGASDGHVYYFGGYDDPGIIEDDVYRYSPGDDEWTQVTSMPVDRDWFGAAEVNGKIYVLGGYSGEIATNDIYDIADDSWSTGADLPTPRGYVSPVAVGTKVYVIGGYRRSGDNFDNVDIYDTGTDSWSTGAPIPVAVDSYGIVAVNGRIYVVGGYNDDDDNYTIDNVQEYDVASDTWSQANPLSMERSYLGAAVVGGKIYAIGGEVPDQELTSLGAGPARRGQVSAEGVSAQAVTGLNEEGTFAQAPAPTPSPAPSPTPPPEVPEPGSMLLLASGLAGLGGFGALRAMVSRRAKK